MTTDERLNNIEDRLNKIVSALNHNNKISKDVSSVMSKKVLELSLEIEKLKTQITSSNVGFGDIFNQNPFGGKR